MKGKIRNSLLMQMTAIFVAILFIVLTAFSLSELFYTKQIRENTLELNKKIVTQMDGKVKEFYESMKILCASLAYSPTTYKFFAMDNRERISHGEDLQAVMSSIMLIEDDIKGIRLYDMQMNQIASEGENPGDRKPKFEDSSNIIFSRVFTKGNQKDQYYVIQYPVYDLENMTYGVQVGVCELLMKTDKMVDMLADAQSTAHTQIYLIDSDDRIVASNMPIEVTYLPQKLQEQTRDYYVETFDLCIDGWRILERIPLEELPGKNDSARNIFWIAYAIAALMIIVLVWFFYRRLIRPIRSMDVFIRGLINEPEKRIQTLRKDEIGNVMKSLNRMLDDIQESNEKLQNSQREMYEAEIARKQLQVLAYRNQINPHFLYNTFECIRSMALYYEVEDIAEITMALSDVFRFAVKADNIVTVEDEVNYIREYATIIEYRFMGKIMVDVELDEQAAKKKVIKLMLQPLVENAVFHGLEQKMEGGLVDVSVRMYDEHHIIFVIEDDGCGMDEKTLEALKSNLENQESSKGVGVANIYQRLRLFYGEHVVFDIESRTGEGTCITIIVPDEVAEGGKIDV